jgi:hypothetical protein
MQEHVGARTCHGLMRASVNGKCWSRCIRPGRPTHPYPPRPLPCQPFTGLCLAIYVHVSFPASLNIFLFTCACYPSELLCGCVLFDFTNFPWTIIDACACADRAYRDGTQGTHHEPYQGQRVRGFQKGPRNPTEWPRLSRVQTEA